MPSPEQEGKKVPQAAFWSMAGVTAALGIAIAVTGGNGLGALTGSEVRISSASNTPSDPHLLWAGSGFGVAWSDGRIISNDEISFAMVSDAGAMISGESRITNYSGISWEASIAWTGSVYGLTWEDYRTSSFEVYFNLIDPCP